MQAATTHILLTVDKALSWFTNWRISSDFGSRTMIPSSLAAGLNRSVDGHNLQPKAMAALYPYGPAVAFQPSGSRALSSSGKLRFQPAVSRDEGGSNSVQLRAFSFCNILVGLGSARRFRGRNHPRSPLGVTIVRRLAGSTSTLVDSAAITKAFNEACRNGKQQAVLSLLNQHPDVIRCLVSKPVGKDRITPFSYLCWFVLCDAIETVCRDYGDEMDAEVVDHALSLVCRFGKAEALKILIRHFPEVCRKAMVRDLAEACRKSRLQVALCLLESFPQETVAALKSTSPDKTTALYWACRNGLHPVVEIFIRHPSEVMEALRLKDGEGQTGLSHACQNGHEQVVKLLIDLLPSADAADDSVTVEPSVPSAEVSQDPVMVSPDGRQLLQQQGYRLVGSHSAIKQCRWTKSAMLGEGQCYKHTFYGINSHRCMEGTPSLACANKCTFCWRGHANPVTTSWTYQTDDPKSIVSESIARHLELVENVAASPRALPERIAEARRVGHMALSLVGEPVLYPHAPELVHELHKRGISTFLVTNGQFPEELQQLSWVTQLYVSLDAPNEHDLKEISRPLFKDHWQRLRRSLEVLREKRPYQRSVARLTVLKDKNMDKDACDGYAELVQLGDCDFVEVKGATFAGWDDRTGLSMESVPWHEDVRDFAQQLSQSLPGYEIACEHEHSCSVLLAHRDRFFTPFG